MVTFLLAAAASTGVALLVGDLWGMRGAPSPRLLRVATSIPADLRGWMIRSGLEDVSPRQFLTVSVGVGAGVALATSTLLGFGVPAVAVGVCGALAPAAVWRRRRARVRSVARESWPGIIEEVRVRVGAIGRSIPHTLIEAGLRAQAEVRPAFLAAQREWTLTTDFARTTSVLKDRLQDPTADAVCETLLVVQEVGGDLDSRLEALAEDRRVALRDRAEAEARQAGARLARWFVIIVPAGMAFAGLSLGDGSDAYRSGGGQIATVGAIGLVALCWWWAGRIMQVADERRVFDR